MPANEGTFTAFIALRDAFTGPVRPITGAIRGLTNATSDAERQIERLGRVRGFATLTGYVRLFNSHLGTLGATLGTVHSRMAGLIPAWGALAGAVAAGFSVRGLIGLAGETAEARAEQLHRVERLGGDPAKLGALTAAAKLSHVPVELLDTGIAKLQDNVVKASQGQNKDLVGLFQKLHIDIMRDGKVRGGVDLIPQLADAFKNTSNESMRTRMARALFGRTGDQLLPMLRGGGDEIRSLNAEFSKSKYVFTKDDDENLKKYNRSMILLNASVTGLRYSLGSAMAPALLPIMQTMREWLDNSENRKWLQEGLKSAITDIGKELRKIDWRGLGDDVRGAFRAMRWAIDEVGGLARAIEILIGLKIAGWAGGLAFSLLGIGTQAGATKVALEGVKDAAIGAGAASAWAPLLARLAAWARVMGPIAAAAYVLWPSSTAGSEGDERPKGERPPGTGNSADLSRRLYEAGLTGRRPSLLDFTSLHPSMEGVIGAGGLPPPAISFNLPPRSAWGLPNGMAPLGPTFGPQLPLGGAGHPVHEDGLPARLEMFPLTRQSLPELGALPVRASLDGEFRLKVDINGLPPGSKVETTKSGDAPVTPEVSVGYSHPAFVF